MVISSLWENVFKVPILLTNFKYSMFLNYSLIEFLLLNLNYLTVSTTRYIFFSSQQSVRTLSQLAVFVTWVRQESSDDWRTLVPPLRRISGSSSSESHRTQVKHCHPVIMFTVFIPTQPRSIVHLFILYVGNFIWFLLQLRTKWLGIVWHHLNQQ